MMVDEFDAQLADATRSLVAEPVSLEVVDASAALRRGHRQPLAPVLAVVGILAVVAAAIVVPRLSTAGAPGAVPAPGTATGVSADLPAGVPSIGTADGRVFARRADASIQLVLRRSDGSDLVLASLPEAVPGARDSMISVHLVECPPSTGLDQRYYVFGQAHPVYSADFVYDGITGTGAFRNDLYLVSIASDPTLHDWRFWLDGNNKGKGGGAAAHSFNDLPSYGEVSSAGCVFNPK